MLFVLIFLVICLHYHMHIIRTIFMNNNSNNRNNTQLRNNKKKSPNHRLPINIRTRGNKDAYTLIGYLIEKNNDTKPALLPVYGTQTYPRSSKWLYYTYTDQYNKIKLPIYNQKQQNCQNEYGCNELFENDEISINAYTNQFIYKPYPKNEFRYIPY